MNTDKVVSEPTAGALFKKKYGFSKTLARNMRRKGLNPFQIADIEKYRDIIKQWRKTNEKLKKAKHDAKKSVRSSSKTTKVVKQKSK